MGLHDREWYQKELQNRAGRPVTIEQKMAASAARHTSKVVPLHRPRHKTPTPDKLPIKAAFVTILALLLLALLVKWAVTR